MSRQTVARFVAQGQVTLPQEFLSALGIDAQTLLGVSLVDDHIEIVPLGVGDDVPRRYSDEDIDRFLQEDALDSETASRIAELLNRHDAGGQA